MSTTTGTRSSVRPTQSCAPPPTAPFQVQEAACSPLPMGTLVSSTGVRLAGVRSFTTLRHGSAAWPTAIGGGVRSGAAGAHGAPASKARPRRVDEQQDAAVSCAFAHSARGGPANRSCAQLGAEQRRLLCGQPTVEATRESVIGGHLAAGSGIPATRRGVVTNLVSPGPGSSRWRPALTSSDAQA